MDANRDCSTVGLFSLDPLNVDHEFLTVALSHLADLLSFVVATNNLKEKDNVIYSFFLMMNKSYQPELHRLYGWGCCGCCIFA